MGMSRGSNSKFHSLYRVKYVIGFLTVCSHIINICRRIQVIAGQTLDDETARKVFPSFVWLLRDVVLTLPKGVENLKKYFLEKVFKAEGRTSEKSRRVVDNILKYFPDFDAFPLSPPSSDAIVIQHLSEESKQREISSSFLKGVEDFKQMLKAKLSPKQSFSGTGLVTGQALATLLEEYVRAVNSPGAVPVVQSAWDVVTKDKCTKALENAKAVYEGGMEDLMRDIRLPCDDKTIRHYHEEQLLAALTFFERLTEDIEVTARWIYIEELANYVEKKESALLRDNNSQTEQECMKLMKSLRETYLESVLSDLGNPNTTDFLVLEKRLRSAYEALDSNFRKEAVGSNNLCSNLAYIYELQHNEEMKEHLAQLKIKKKYFEEIASERAVREAEAEETQKIRGANALLEERKETMESMIADLEKEHVKGMEALQRMMQEQMRSQREQAQAAETRAREESEAEKEQNLRQQRQLQAQISEAQRKQQEQERTINNLRDQLRRM